jgi:hypothetical protein
MTPAVDALPYVGMADDDAKVRRNADALWNMFSPDDYWRQNYSELQPEDQEIIHRVSEFFSAALEGQPPVRRAIDVGAGTNFYPALLMLPWAEQILLADFSKSNVQWLHEQLTADDTSEWQWDCFWREMQKLKKYRDLDQPRERLREACVSEERSVFDLPRAQWDLGTMFFVAESITEDPEEFRAAVNDFVAALTPGAPFAAAFMEGSAGYAVDGTDFPALPIKPEDVKLHLSELGVHEPNVIRLETSHRVRDGYEGMIVATGFAGNLEN